MLHALLDPFVRLFETNPEIERRPFMARPRTMAAAWGGLLVCKLAAMVVISPEAGATMFMLTLIGGLAATYIRFGRRPEQGLVRTPAHRTARTRWLRIPA